MSEEEKQAAGSSEEGMSHKDMLQMDLKTVDQMTRWRKKLSKGENIKIKVLDKGMMPTVMIGDTVEVMPVHAMNLKTGNVIFFRQSENFLVRRIVEVVYGKSGEYRVRGDAIETEEPSVVAGQIIGKVVAVERNGQRLEVERNIAGAALGKLRQLGSTKIGSEKDYSREKEMASAAMGKVVEFFEKAYQKLCESTDKLIEMIFSRKK
ncbi:MAG: hypothetical protein RDV48_04080 [Candidatus Eremiobacteraeota bacterium]|nr:hypothetical protein [Candidatus Eremiobacteraeota bacterium]